MIDEPKPPITPDICDSSLELDAVTTMQGEMFFFKDGYCPFPSVNQCITNINDIQLMLLLFSGMCGITTLRATHPKKV